MIISFDLDNTLIPYSQEFETEPQGFLHKVLNIPKIRRGSIELFKKLKSRKHQIYIYTTSFRAVFSIHFTFWFYGIPVHRVINQSVHNQVLKEKSTLYYKYPPAFGIDVHIDDSKGLKEEGQRLGFQIIHVAPEDGRWAEKIILEMSES